MFIIARPLSSDVVLLLSDCCNLTLAPVISRHRVFATRYGPIITGARPRSLCSRPLLLTVSDATVAWPEPE